MNARVITLILFFPLLLSACQNWPSALSRDERQLIKESGDVMRVLTIDDPSDSLILRSISKDFSLKDLQSDELALLSEKLISTVTSPEQDGVGIAGPQVGISRRIVAVQRFDKEGSPFEVYPNISILECRGPKEAGAEGCLSIPNRRGEVFRYRDIDIKYSLKDGRDTVETVKGFTAVIFQHECDHLEGIIYTDRISGN